MSGYYQVNKRWPKPSKLISGNYDLLIMPYGDPDCVVASFLCRVMGKKYCIFSPNNLFDFRPRSLVREILKKSIFSHASGVLTTGESQKEYVTRYWRQDNGLYIVGNPAPPLKNLDNLSSSESRRRLRVKFGWEYDFVILYVGRLSNEKGIGTLFLSLAQLNKKGSNNYRAVLVGSGPEESALRKEAREKRLNVEFKGFQEGQALTEIFLSADIFVLPSSSEPWGLVVNEAMEAGLPVIVSNKVGASRALVFHEINGLIFPVEEVDALTESIMRLCSDAQLRLAMSNRSREIIHENSIEKWSDKVILAVNEILEN